MKQGVPPSITRWWIPAGYCSATCRRLNSPIHSSFSFPKVGCSRFIHALEHKHNNLSLFQARLFLPLRSWSLFLLAAGLWNGSHAMTSIANLAEERGRVLLHTGRWWHHRRESSHFPLAITKAKRRLKKKNTSPAWTLASQTSSSLISCW